MPRESLGFLCHVLLLPFIRWQVLHKFFAKTTLQFYAPLPGRRFLVYYLCLQATMGLLMRSVFMLMVLIDYVETRLHQLSTAREQVKTLTMRRLRRAGFVFCIPEYAF
jgi:hypothetical protein